jgi:hypothetical protein
MTFNIKKLALIWWDNKYTEPKTNKKLSKYDLLFNFFLKVCLVNNLINDPYHDYHSNYIDPILKTELDKSKKLFKYKYVWDPYNGERLGIDPRGPLYFDPSCLVYYFFKNRLKKLYVFPTDDFNGYYDDGVGLGETFYRKDIGYNLHWYLFRLPLQFGNYSKNLQQTTIGPKLNFNDISDIYNKTILNKDFEQTYNIEVPDIIYIYYLYHQAIGIFDDIDTNILAIQMLLDMEVYSDGEV